MNDSPMNPWRDDDILLGGLAIAYQALSVLLENITAVRESNAQPHHCGASGERVQFDD